MRALTLMKIINNFALVFAVLSFLFAGVGGKLTDFSYIFLCVVVYIAFHYKSKKTVYIGAMLGLVLPVFYAESFLQILYAVIAGSIALLYIRQDCATLDYLSFLDEFTKGRAILGVLLGTATLFFRLTLLGQTSGYYILLYLITAVLLLRSLRNRHYGEGDATQGRIDGALTATYALMALLFSSNSFITFVTRLLQSVYLGAVEQVASLLAWILQPLEPGFVMMVMWADRCWTAFHQYYGAGYRATSSPIQGELLARAAPIYEIVGMLIKTLMLAGLVWLAVKVFIRQYRWVRTMDQYTEIKESITDVKRLDLKSYLLSKFKPRTSKGRIRAYYAEFLQLCCKRQIALKGGDTTHDISNKAVSAFEKDAVLGLRNLYIRVRYGNDAGNREMETLAGAFLRKMKR